MSKSWWKEALGRAKTLEHDTAVRLEIRYPDKSTIGYEGPLSKAEANELLELAMAIQARRKQT